MELLSLRDVEAARARLAPLHRSGSLRRTPLLGIGGLAGAEVHLKLELLQVTGSFKPRGAFNTLAAARADDTLPAAGVIAASGGNAGLGVAHAARTFGVTAEIFVPTACPPVKIARLRALDARVKVTGDYYADALAAMRKRAADTGALAVHAYDQVTVAAGQGTIGLELLDDAVPTDTVLVAVGGGGLLAGILAALSESGQRVVAVEPERCPTLHSALAAGHPVDVEVGGIAADSLGARQVSRLAHDLAVEHAVSSVLVTDAAIADAQHWLWDTCRVVAEPGGATATAALLSGAYRPQPGERITVIVCGANTDPATVSASTDSAPTE